MQADLEVRLTHDGHRWIAYHPSFEARGKTLLELDQDVTRCLLDQKLFQQNNEVMVFMAFDYTCIPAWIRQYAYHYFNRYIRLELDLKSTTKEAQ